MKVVECLKCNNHFFEQDKFINKCLFCGNKDTQKTIYLEEEGSIYKSIITSRQRSEEMLRPNDKARIKGTCIVGSISRINHVKNLALFDDEEVNKHIYIAINKLEKLYE